MAEEATVNNQNQGQNQNAGNSDTQSVNAKLTTAKSPKLLQTAQNRRNRKYSGIILNVRDCLRRKCQPRSTPIRRKRQRILPI